MRDPASQTAIPVDIHQPPAFLHKILQLSAVQLLYDNNGVEQVMDTWDFLCFFFLSSSHFSFFGSFLSDIADAVNVICLFSYFSEGPWQIEQLDTKHKNDP